MPRALGWRILTPMFVCVLPGQMALQRMPVSAYMNATFFVGLMTANYEAGRRTSSSAHIPDSDAVLMMTRLRRAP